MLELTSVSPEARAFTCIVPPDDSSCLFPARLGSLWGQGPHLVSGVTSGEWPRSCRSHSGLWFSLGEHVPPPSQRGSLNVGCLSFHISLRPRSSLAPSLQSQRQTPVTTAQGHVSPAPGEQSCGSAPSRPARWCSFFSTFVFPCSVWCFMEEK